MTGNNGQYEPQTDRATFRDTPYFERIAVALEKIAEGMPSKREPEDVPVSNLIRAIRWALGEIGTFESPNPKKPYGWRSRLRKLAWPVEPEDYAFIAELEKEKGK